MSDQTTSFKDSGTPIYKIGSFGYQGSKLTSINDSTVAGTNTLVSYSYDQQGRLLTAAAAKAGPASSPVAQIYSETYRQGDPAWGDPTKPADSSLGNLGQVIDASGTTGYAYAADRVAEQYGAKNFLIQYDHAGRLSSRRPTATPTTELEGYAWDLQDQLRQVRTAGAVSEVIDYDPTGLPLFRRVGSVGTWYVGKMATVTATVSATCTGAASCLPTTTPAVAVHLLLGGTRIATVKAPAPSTATDAFAEVLYYHRDYQGSVIGTSRRGAGLDGLSGAKYRYTPYGQLDKVDGVTAQTDSELGDTGGLRLGYVAGAVTTLAAPQAPGLVLLGARVYHQELKRWLVPDTVDPLRYTYTGGDPVNFIDPSGRLRIDGHSERLQSTPRMFEDYFMSITAQYATAGFDTARRHLRDDLAWAAAGYQGPVLQWESAVRAQLARASSQYLNDVVAEAMASADAFEREAAARGLAEQSARVLAQAYTDFRVFVLAEAQDAARANPKFQRNYGGAGNTWCNAGTVSTVKGAGGPTGALVDSQGNALLANTIAANLATSDEWREVGPITAQYLANHGSIVIAAQENHAEPDSHGHVATVRPFGETGDGVTARRGGPYVNQIGWTVGVMLANMAFLPAPIHFYALRSSWSP